MNAIPETTSVPSEAREVIVSYLRRRDGRRMVTTTDAIGHLRGRFPSLATSDGLLADVVAGAAIALGLDVELDGGEGHEALFDRWARDRANYYPQQ